MYTVYTHVYIYIYPQCQDVKLIVKHMEDDAAGFWHFEDQEDKRRDKKETGLLYQSEDMK